MDAAKADLIRALGRLVRGLSTLFWGIPLALAADVETARSDWLDTLGALGFAPAFVLSALLWFGLRQMRDFQKQERVWHHALDRAELFAIVNAGLAPFLSWRHHFPRVPLYLACVVFMGVSGYLFLICFNQVLRRLAAMLPDETLRLETRVFAAWNTWMLAGALAGLSFEVLWPCFGPAAPFGAGHVFGLDQYGGWLILFLTLTPLAITLALLWKMKEAIFTSIFELER